MDAPQRTRSCRRDQPTATTSQSRGSRQICLPMDRETYDRLPDRIAVRELRVRVDVIDECECRETRRHRDG